ncbi:MAG TPA: hypothetical protein VKB27_14850 [Gammaproteobacteria bacterium]|nr:hypothetical protein [Gammaproteobacteria bacterium]
MFAAISRLLSATFAMAILARHNGPCFFSFGFEAGIIAFCQRYIALFKCHGSEILDAIRHRTNSLSLK